MPTEEQKQQYLKDVSEAAERVKQYIKLQHSPQLQRQQQQQQQQETFERIPLPGNDASMLGLNATSGSGSTLEMWEESVDQRLSEIDSKLNGSDLSAILTKDDMDF